jgi:signal transduction histidine kinase
MPPGRRGKYLGFVAHEIKNPLATALWSCDLLKRMDAADRAGPRADKMIDASLRALRRMRRLVDDYFTIERLQEQGYELRPEPVEVHGIVEGAIAQLGEKEGVPTDGWSIDVPAQVQVACDHDMLKRGIRLLLEHLGRSSKGAEVSVVGRSTPQGAQIVLRADPKAERITPPVPEERPSGDPSGAVLGFALADSIVRAHGGSIEEREGALFVLVPPPKT